MDWHPIASVFPMLEGDELQALADDIKAHGLNEPVTLFEGKILDGRNRSAACKLAGIEPVYIDFHGTRAEALALAWSKNRVRRHLDSSQAAIAEARRAKLSQEYSAELERLKSEAAERKAEGQKSGGKARHGQLEGTNSTKQEESGKVREQRAKAAGTNAKYIDAADKIEAERPDLGDKILKGEMTIPQARREMTPKAERCELELIAESAETTAELLKQIAALAKSVSVFAKSKAGAFVNAALVNRTLKELRQELQRAVLAQPCDECRGKGCMLCKDVGFVTEGHCK